MLIGDFNLTVRSKNFEVIMNTFDLECLITKSKCSQSAHPNYIDIDLILATKKKKKKIKNSDVLEVSGKGSGNF